MPKKFPPNHKLSPAQQRNRRHTAFRKQRRHESNEFVSTDEVKCVRCGVVSKKLTAIANGSRILRGGARCICNECQ